MTTWLVYPLLTTALYYLGAKAMITSPLWSRYPVWLDRFLSCPACAGTWYGAAVAVALGVPLDLPFAGLDGRQWYTPVVVAGCAMIWTPILAALHVQSIETIERTGPEPEPEPEDDFGEG